MTKTLHGRGTTQGEVKVKIASQLRVTVMSESNHDDCHIGQPGESLSKNPTKHEDNHIGMPW